MAPFHPAALIAADRDGPIEIADRIGWVGRSMPGDPFRGHAYRIGGPLHGVHPTVGAGVARRRRGKALTDAVARADRVPYHATPRDRDRYRVVVAADMG